MESEQLDAVLHTLASATSRRGVLGVLAGLAGLSLSEVAAKRRQRGTLHSTGHVRASDAQSGDHQGHHLSPYGVEEASLPGHHGRGQRRPRA